jgi:LysM repeat protein
VVVVCLSKQFNQAGFRQKEVRLALDTAMEKPEGEIFIIPARLEECDTLESLRKWHWVDLFENDGYRKLLRTLRIRADKIGATLLKEREESLKGYVQPGLTKTPSLPTEKPTISKQEKPVTQQVGGQISKTITKTLIGIFVLISLFLILAFISSLSPQMPLSPPSRAFSSPVSYDTGMGTIQAHATGTSLAKTALAPTEQTFSASPFPTHIRPITYTKQVNEFEYCLARRFNVDPDDLLILNGLQGSEIVPAGIVLKIPQTGTFPGDRALRRHPTTYTVTGNNDTNLYGVACMFGDVFPEDIASLNGLPLNSTLKVGQVLQIP